MKLFKHVLIALLASGSFTALAYTPLFSMTEINVPSIVIAGKTAVLSYRVTPNATNFINQPNGVVLNAMTPAVTSFIAPKAVTDCAAIETFSMKTTCTLKMVVDATHLQVGQVITGKPIFCNHPELAHPMYCSQPAEAVNIKVVSPDDPSISAVTVTPNNAIDLYPGESQILTVKNTSGDNVTEISATATTAENFIITNNCGALAQGASCTIVLNTTPNATMGERDIVTIQANDYAPITVPIVISPVTVVAGTYVNLTDAFEGLIWVKKTAWSKTLPTALEKQPIIFFATSNDPQHINDWLVIGSTRNNNTPRPWPPKPPYSFHDKPVILESTDNAQNFTQVTPNISLPENSTFMSANINNGFTVFAGFDGDLTITPHSQPILQDKFNPLVITRDNNGIWINEPVNLSEGDTAGALMSVTADGDNQYAAGTQLNKPFPVATIWQRQLDPSSDGYAWNELPYYSDFGPINAAVGLFSGVHANANNLVAVGMQLDLSMLPILQLSSLFLIIGNYDPVQAQWTWSQFPAPAPSNIKKTLQPNAGFSFSELSSVSANPKAPAGEAAWVAVGYSATTTGDKTKPLTNAQPLIYVNTSQNADATNWILVDLSKTVPRFESWELDSVTWNGQEWMAVGTRYSTLPIPLNPFLPLVLVSLDGLKWTEVLDGLPAHSSTELVPLLFAAR
jgi:hypothetical protein